ncbi:MAG: helix-turn-helix domain-containing protein [Patescibacteria group bacterium]|jgi:DNA-binding MarR family transcriptional regulator
MAKTIERLLGEIGLSAKEQAVYRAVVELGDAPVSPIAKRARINRATAYSILDHLIGKGLVAKSEQKKKLHYSAKGTGELEEYLMSQKANWDGIIHTFHHLKPELEALLGSAGVKPTVRFFEGKLGVKEVFFDQIRGDHKEILAYGSAGKLEELMGSDYLKMFTKQKSKTNIVTRAILPDEPISREYVKKYYPEKGKQLFDIKVVSPDEFPMEMEMNIYGNKVSMISLNPAEPVAVIIESPALVRNQRIIFNLLWKRL